MAKLKSQKNEMALRRPTKSSEAEKTEEVDRQRYKRNEHETDERVESGKFHFQAKENKRILKLTGTPLWEYISPEIGTLAAFFM